MRQLGEGSALCVSSGDERIIKAAMDVRRLDIVSTPIPTASLDALIDLMVAQSGRDDIAVHDVSELLLAALALRTALRTGKQVFFVI